jgi:hypothetical protein
LKRISSFKINRQTEDKKMKTILRVSMVIVLMRLMLLPARLVTARTNRIEFSGAEWCDPTTLTVVREWLAGPNYQARGLTQTCHDTASIPQMNGTDFLSDGRILVVGNAGNFIMTGKLRMESAEGGVWVGSWTWPVNSDTVQVIGHGEGLYEGLHLHWFLTLAGPFFGYISGSE